MLRRGVPGVCYLVARDLSEPAARFLARHFTDLGHHQAYWVEGPPFDPGHLGPGDIVAPRPEALAPARAVWKDRGAPGLARVPDRPGRAGDRERPPMIRHVVLIRFRSDVPEAERAALRDGLRDLPVGRPGAAAEYRGFAWGPDASPEGLQRGFGAGFTIDFADAAARDAYLADPGHRALGARLVAAAEGGVDGLLVVDLDLG